MHPSYEILFSANGTEGKVKGSNNCSVCNFSLAPSNGTWYVLETNYDPWKAPLFVDDRRTPVIFGLMLYNLS